MEGMSKAAFDGEVLHEQELTLLGDGAQTVDLLGYQPYVDALVEVLAQERLQTPFAVGVFGRWGTGKSTFMNLLRNCLSIEARRARGEPGGFHSVLFQPWQFEDKEEVWKALLLSVIRYLEVVQARRSTAGGQQAERIKRTLAELALSVGKLALNKTVQTMTSGVLDLDQVLDAYAKTARDNSQFINTFREKFGALKQEILTEEEGDVPRLFVFVDDLDRCTPDNCIMVLEAIKLFFDLPECVFVLGIDREVVQRGIEQKYRQNLGIHGQDYIDKLIQLPFSLPPIRQETFERFVRSITGSFEFSPEIQALIVRAAEGNPRLAKRLSNCLQLTRTVARRLYDSADPALMGDIEKLDEAKLALLLTLQVRYPVAYLWLTYNPRTLEELREDWLPRSVDVQKGTAASEGFRSQIVRFLQQAYGDRVAEQNSDGFFALWRYAHGSAVAVESFRDRQELQAYMRITGIVDEDRAGDAARNQPPTAKDTIDSAFLGPEPADEEERALSDDGGVPQRPHSGPTEEQRSAIEQRAVQLRNQARAVVQNWDVFSHEGVQKAPLVLPGILRRAERLVEAARRNAERIDEILLAQGEIPPEVTIDLRDLRGELREVDERRVYRHVVSLASAFTFVWPLAVLALGVAVGFLLQAWMDLAPASAATDFIERLAVTGGPVALAPDADLLDYAFAVPGLFPGGPLFFWAALVYAVVAVVIWLRALGHVNQPLPADTDD